MILQHGEKASRPGDPGLTAKGRRQADLAAIALAALEPAAVVSSPLLRAQQTATPLAARSGLALDTDPRLRERLNLEVGQERGAFIRAWQTTVRDRNWHPPGGRSSRATAADMREALDTHAVTGGLVVLASHGGATIDLLRELLGDDELELRAPGTVTNGLPGGAITTLVQHDSAWIVTGIGCVNHLPPGDQTGHVSA